MSFASSGGITFSRRVVDCLVVAAGGVLLSRGAIPGLDARRVFLASIAVFGLAHGACDLWLPGWVLARKTAAWFTAAFALAYLGLTVPVLLLWRWCPGVALAGFLLLTAWHWGSAEAVLTGSRSRGFGLLAWGHGLMVMAAPAAFHPQATWRVLEPCAGRALAGLPPGRLQSLAATVLAAGICLQLLSLPWRSTGAGLGGHWLETLFLLAFYAILDPLIATALYFVWFHAWRHILRLCRWQSPGERSLLVCLARFHLAALPCALGALALLWLVARLWPGDLLRAYLVLLSAVTLPHALLVLWLDRVESLPAMSTAGTGRIGRRRHCPDVEPVN